MNKLLYSVLLCLLMAIGIVVPAMAQKKRAKTPFITRDGIVPEYTIAERVDLSDAVFEGIVIDYNVFKGSIKPNTTDSTYRVHYVAVTKVFKGTVPDTVELVSAGGWLKNQRDSQGFLIGSEPTFAISKKSSGIFFTTKSKASTPHINPKLSYELILPKVLEIWGNQFTFIGYGNPYEKRNEQGLIRFRREIERNYYRPIQKQTHKKFKERLSYLPKKTFPMPEVPMNNKVLASLICRRLACQQVCSTIRLC